MAENHATLCNNTQKQAALPVSRQWLEAAWSSLFALRTEVNDQDQGVDRRHWRIVAKRRVVVSGREAASLPRHEAR